MYRELSNGSSVVHYIIDLYEAWNKQEESELAVDGDAQYQSREAPPLSLARHEFGGGPPGGERNAGSGSIGDTYRTAIVATLKGELYKKTKRWAWRDNNLIELYETWNKPEEAEK